MVGMNLFPVCSLRSSAAGRSSPSKEDFALYNTARAPGANTRRVQFGYSAGSYALEQHALEAVAPWEHQQEASQVAGIQLASMAVRKTQNIIALRLEKPRPTATTAASYAARATRSPSPAPRSGVTTPVFRLLRDIETAKDVIRAQIGKRGNTVLVGAAVWKALRQHPAIIDRIKYTPVVTS